MKKPFADCSGLAQKDQSQPEIKVIAGHIGEAGAKHAGKPGVSVTRQLMMKQREMMTYELDQYFISKGLSVDIELSGPDITSISLLSPLFCKDSVDRITERTNLLFYLKEAGFRKATIGDSNEKVWAYDLRAL
jgi:hypothetical protein